VAVVHSAQARNACTEAVLALIGAGGFLKFRLSGTISSPGAVVASLPLSDPAFGAASGGTATANAMTPDSNAIGNAAPVAAASFETAGGVLVIHCAVGAEGADIIMTNGLVVAPGDSIVAGELTYAALPA
jgi:hypothetical protein